MPDAKDIVLIEESEKVNHPEIVANILNQYSINTSNKFPILTK